MRPLNEMLPEKVAIAKQYLFPFMLIVSAFLLFSNTFLNSWTYDDFKLIVNNPDIRSLDLFAKNSQPGRVLREISLMMDYKLFGLNPVGFHIQNILWHGINAILIMVLVGRLGGSPLTSRIASILFLIHPVQVEVVANLTHRKDSIALAFILLSILSYLEFFRGNSRKIACFALSLLFFTLAILAKENAIIIPLMFIAYEILFVDEKDRFLLKYKRGLIVLFVLAAIIAVIYFFYAYGVDNYYLLLKAHLDRQNYFASDLLRAHYMLAVKSWSFMFLKLLVPLGMAVEYTFSVPESWLDIWLIASAILMLLFLVVLFSFRKAPPLLIFSLLWFCVFWLPTSNLFPLSYYAADRYLYAPSVGFFVIGALLFDGVKCKNMNIKYGTLSLIMVAMIFLTWSQNAVWRSPASLWVNAYKVNPSSAFVLNNMGMVYMQKGDRKKAMELFHEAVETNPSNATAQYNLGYLYESAGDREKSRQYYATFVSLNPPAFQDKVKKVRKKLLNQY